MKTVTKEQFTVTQKKALEAMNLIAIFSQNKLDLATFNNITILTEQAHDESIKLTIRSIDTELDRLKRLYPDWEK